VGYVLEFAFESAGVKALFAGHLPANSTSLHLILKLGFRRTHNEFDLPTGLFHRLTPSNPRYFHKRGGEARTG
jgi:RimJ/RimL family protein N-acetyltransferase